MENDSKTRRKYSAPEMEPEQLPVRFRRGSVMEFPNRNADKPDLTTSMDFTGMTKSEMKNIKRRATEASIFNADRRISIGTIGKSMTALLRAKNAFAQHRNRKLHIQNDDIDDSSCEIKQLPRKPRFASTLSTEAQYAMMKGYEDQVYRNLCNQFPEYKPVLRRNKTPHHGIKIKLHDIPSMDDDVEVNARSGSEDEAEADSESPEPGAPESAIDAVDGQLTDMNFAQSPRLVTADCQLPGLNSITSPRLATADGQLPGLNSITSPRLASSCAVTPRTKMLDTNPRLVQTAHRRRSGFPKVKNTPALVMTYRYESAMDILDSLRERQGQHRLSPRKTSTVARAPVKEYNSWSYVWSREFEPTSRSSKF